MLLGLQAGVQCKKIVRTHPKNYPFSSKRSVWTWKWSLGKQTNTRHFQQLYNYAGCYARDSLPFIHSRAVWSCTQRNLSKSIHLQVRLPRKNVCECVPTPLHTRAQDIYKRSFFYINFYKSNVVVIQFVRNYRRFVPSRSCIPTWQPISFSTW